MISVIIVDDHNIARFGIKRMLADATDIKIVGEAESGEIAIRLVRELKPDVVLMDIQMPGMSGLETAQKLLRVYPTLKIIGLSAHDEDPFPASLMRQGALGYLTKNTNPNELAIAIRNVCAGHPYITPTIAHNLSYDQLKGDSSSIFTKLSQRELEVLYLLIKGNSINAISESMHISVKTISTYKHRLFAKLAVKNEVELTHLALRYGILDSTHLNPT